MPVPAEPTCFDREVAYAQEFTEHLVAEHPSVLLERARRLHAADARTVITVGLTNGTPVAKISAWRALLADTLAKGPDARRTPDPDEPTRKLALATALAMREHRPPRA